MTGNSKSEIDEWLDANLPRAWKLTPIVTSLLDGILKRHGIEYLSVTGRTKTIESAREKIARKSYVDLDRQFTDLCGIRIITFLNSNVNQVNAVIRSMFAIDENNSTDKLSSLGHDRMGYRSVHFVCTIGERRAELPEYSDLGSMKFEIQVRTVLQHAWAELAHDRSFKLGQTLPIELQRKLNLYSGMLELVDLGFDDIVSQMDEYASKLASSGPQMLSNSKIDSISIEALNKTLIRNFRLLSRRKVKIDDVNEIVAELHNFGLSTIDDIEHLITQDFTEAMRTLDSPMTIKGFFRLLMMYHDLNGYFERCNPSWQYGGRDLLKFLSEKYTEEQILSSFETHSREIIRDE